MAAAMRSDCRCAQHMGAAPGGRADAAWKETLCDLPRAEILDLAEAELGQPRAERVAVEMALDGFAEFGDPRRERFVRRAVARFDDRSGRIDVVEHHMRAAG